MAKGSYISKVNKKKTLQQTTIDFQSTTSIPYTPIPQQQTQWRIIPISGVPVRFPFQPYPAQIQMMAKILKALKDADNALLESPTGSGKSLALLCATIAWREHQVQIAYDNLKKAQEQEQNASRQAWNDYIETCSRLPVIQKQQKKSNELSAITNVQTIKSTEDDDDFQPIPTVKRRRLQKDTKSSTPDILEKSTNLYQGSIGDNTNNKNDDDDDDNHLLDEKHTTNGISKVSNSITSSSQSSAIQRSLEKIPKIYVCSRTHKQIEQLIGELKELTNYRPRMTVLGSREQLCVHPKVSKSANKNDDCTSLLDTASCVYARQTNQLLGHATVRPSNRALWDIEDIVKLGKSTRGCPYYATRSLFENAEIIFCPYNYVIDPIIRRIMDIKVEGNIIIFDEAHNIEDIARSAGSFETTEADLKRIQKELNQVIRGQQLPNDHNTVLFVVDTLLEWIIEPNNSYSIKEYEKHVHIWSGAQIISKLSELHINPTTFESSIQPAYKNIKAHTERIMNEAEDKSISTTASIGHGGGSSSQGHDKHTRECITTWALRQLDGLFMVFNFLFQDGFDRSFDYSMALIKKIHKASNFVKDASWVYKLGFWCHDPGVVFQELSSVAHSMILTSGTLSPLDTFATELDTKFTSVLEANHVIDSSQVWVGTIPVGPNGTHLKGVYSVVETFNYQDDIGQALQHIVDTVPFGVLCFVPSYSTLDKLIKRWKATGAYSKLEAKKVIYIEPQGDNKQTFQSQLQGFYDTVKQAEQQSSGCTGALFFAVYRGKISEGIDFSNNDCRAVVAIGIPYPNLKDTQVSLKRSYNDNKKRRYPSRRIISGDDWYTIQGYRAINQALGRCIRHKKDWGAIILLEERFNEKKNIEGLSKWIRKLCKIHDQGFDKAIKDLQTFVQGRMDIEFGYNVDIDQ